MRLTAVQSLLFLLSLALYSERAEARANIVDSPKGRLVCSLVCRNDKGEIVDRNGDAVRPSQPAPEPQEKKPPFDSKCTDTAEKMGKFIYEKRLKSCVDAPSAQSSEPATRRITPQDVKVKKCIEEMQKNKSARGLCDEYAKISPCKGPIPFYRVGLSPVPLCD